MTIPATISALPDEAMVPVGWIKAQFRDHAEQIPAVDDEVEATLQMYATKATAKLCVEPWQNSGGTRSGERA